MDSWLQLVITIIGSVLASSGFWAFMQKRNESKDVRSQMLIGLAHDRIMYLGMGYIERGWITQDEYENLYEYLYKPYEKLGGNGSAKRVMMEVNKLPIHKSNYQPKEANNYETL
jgi:hypothetical protein